MRDEIIQQWLSDTDVRRYALPDLDAYSGDTIVAYNFDIVDGNPVEFIGRIADNEHVDESEELSDEQLIADVHERADERAAAVNQRRLTVEPTGTNPENWSDWDQLTKLDDFIEDSAGNAFGWTIDYRENPQDRSTNAVTTEARMTPVTVDVVDTTKNWHNIAMQHKHDWKNNSLVESDMFQHGPGNTVGTTSTGWTFETSLDSSGSTFTIGYSKTNTKSNIDIDDKSSPDVDNRSEHRVEITGDLRFNFVAINTASVADVQFTGDSLSQNPTSVEVTLRGRFKRKLSFTTPPEYTTKEKNVNLQLFGGSY